MSTRSVRSLQRQKTVTRSDKHIDLPLMPEGSGNIVLFYPHVGERARQRAYEQLATRWIGQGPSVEQFEVEFSRMFCGGLPTAAVGSGTDALHLAYMLAGIGPGDEVVTPVFTCTATNIPLLYLGATPVFADIQPHSLNIDPRHVRSLVNDRTRAIVCVHYGGLPCDMDELHQIAADAGIPVIEDAAHALGATYKGRSVGSISHFTMFSFQAIKHITTGDGGMLALRDASLLPKAKRVRWFGIDREGKQSGTWENDIWELGYKYQMTDISAALGLGALEEWEHVREHRRRLLETYESGLASLPGIQVAGAGHRDRVHAAWLCTVFVDDRVRLQRKLRANGIESNQVHYRNDRYTLFRNCRGTFPHMDAVEDRYLVLPLHTRMRVEDAERIVEVIKAGW
jgi:perosamine synthetase